MSSTQCILYDAGAKIWRSVHYEFGDFVNQSVGAAFLESMQSGKYRNKVLEYHYDSGVEKTGQQLYEESVTVAINLQKLGLKKGDVVLLYSKSNPQNTPLTMGCYLNGVVVNYFDPDMSEEHIVPTLELIDPVMILYEECWATIVLASVSRNRLSALQHLISIDGVTDKRSNAKNILFSSVTSAEINSFKAVPVLPKTDTAALVLTSGSTGAPKVVQLTHSNLLYGLKAWWCEPSGQAQPNEQSIICSLSPQRWISQIILQLHAILGIKRVSPRGAPTGAYGAAIIAATGITHFFTVPTAFYEILRSLPAGSKALHSLQVATLGGETPSEELMALSKKLAVNCKSFRCYGMTELSSCIATDSTVNGGTLNPGLQLKVLDENMKALGPNERGQLCLRAPIPLKAYFKRDNSRCLFDDGFFLTGDYGFVDSEHKLHVEARYKDLIRGKNSILVPNPIESFLANLPEVAAARLVGQKIAAASDVETAVLFVRPAEDVAATEDDIARIIHQYLATRLNEKELKVISHTKFVDKMPFTCSGKIDRLALKATLTTEEIICNALHK